MINLWIIENRIGKVGKKGIPIDDLNSQQLKSLKNTVKSLSENEQIGLCNKLSAGGLARKLCVCNR